jgi:hypothetical protein
VLCVCVRVHARDRALARVCVRKRARARASALRPDALEVVALAQRHAGLLEYTRLLEYCRDHLMVCMQLRMHKYVEDRSCTCERRDILRT